MTITNTFCKFLKNGLVYNNNSTHFTVSPCCYFSKNYSIDPSIKINEQVIKHQQSWQNEDVNNTCKICINAESAGIHSYRQASFDEIPGTSEKINFLTVAVTKKCNLACPSCGPDSSSFWYQENIRNNIPQSKNIIELYQDDKQNIITKKFISLFKDQELVDVSYIKFGGGEPLMNDTHAQILKLIPSPEKVIIQYTSNFSIMPSTTILKLWKKFKLVKWIASLDGVGEQFTFLRWPYRWEKLEAFANSAISTVPGNVMFGVEHTINPLNIFYFDQFETWFSKHLGSNRHDDKSDFNVHLCNGVLGLEHTPPELRNKITAKYGNTHQITISLKQKPYSGSTAALVQYLDQLDSQRKTNWRQLFPEVQEFFNV
jgi:hypothetical protein